MRAFLDCGNNGIVERGRGMSKFTGVAFALYHYVFFAGRYVDPLERSRKDAEQISRHPARLL